PARAAAFARALTLVRPVARRRLYWTARTVFVTDPSQLGAFDYVFFSVFGKDDVRVPEDTRAVAAPPREPPRAEQRSAARSAEVHEGVSSFARSARPDDDNDPTEMPVALASNDERLAE